MAAADTELAPLVTRDLLTEVVAMVPEGWLEPEGRLQYVTYLSERAKASAEWISGGET